MIPWSGGVMQAKPMTRWRPLPSTATTSTAMSTGKNNLPLLRGIKVERNPCTDTLECQSEDSFGRNLVSSCLNTFIASVEPYHYIIYTWLLTIRFCVVDQCYGWLMGLDISLHGSRTTRVNLLPTKLSYLHFHPLEIGENSSGWKLLIFV